MGKKTEDYKVLFRKTFMLERFVEGLTNFKYKTSWGAIVFSLNFAQQKLCIYVMQRLYTKFQCSTNWSKSLWWWWCGGGVVVWWLKPTLVFSLAQAEQKC